MSTRNFISGLTPFGAHGVVMDAKELPEPPVEDPEWAKGPIDHVYLRLKEGVTIPIVHYSETQQLLILFEGATEDIGGATPAELKHHHRLGMASLDEWPAPNDEIRALREDTKVLHQSLYDNFNDNVMACIAMGFLRPLTPAEQRAARRKGVEWNSGRNKREAHYKARLAEEKARLGAAAR